jgi:hypothetical protein
MNTRLLLVVILLMGGCAGADSYVYSKPGGTAEQRERDKTDCLFDARTTVPGPDGPQSRVNQDRYRRCMADRGYTLERVAQ